MKPFLIGVCFAVLTLMLYVTVTASLHEDLFTAAGQLWPDPWFRATLTDAYCGFLLFWLWVAWREASPARGALWLVLIMTLGNFAMAGYLLVQLGRWDPTEGVARLLIGERHGVEGKTGRN